MTPTRFPSDYENTAVRAAAQVVMDSPTREALGALLDAAQVGGLAVDVTGSTAETGARVRMVSSTDGRPVLPLFTSVAAVQAAVASADPVESVLEGEQPPVQAAILDATEALGLVRSAPFIAVQFDPGTIGLVVAREHVDRALDGEQPAEDATAS